jgi:hypothetical protein
MVLGMLDSWSQRKMGIMFVLCFQVGGEILLGIRHMLRHKQEKFSKQGY